MRPLWWNAALDRAAESLALNRAIPVLGARTNPSPAPSQGPGTPRYDAAIDEEDLSRDEIGGLGGQVDGRADDVLGRA